MLEDKQVTFISLNNMSSALLLLWYITISPNAISKQTKHKAKMEKEKL
jgi:hypothetical protein